MEIDFNQIRELLAVVSQTEITELTIESGQEKITVKKSTTMLAQTTPTSSIEMPFAYSQAGSVKQTIENASIEPTSEAYEQESNNGLVSITSPMVGTFYRSPSPNAAAFVNIGDHITVGQTVCIIEAMKLMNDLPSEVAGRIVKVCAENGTTVEYGQLLFMIDPNG